MGAYDVRRRYAGDAGVEGSAITTCGESVRLDASGDVVCGGGAEFDDSNGNATGKVVREASVRELRSTCAHQLYDVRTPRIPHAGPASPSGFPHLSIGADFQL